MGFIFQVQAPFDTCDIGKVVLSEIIVQDDKVI